MSGLNELNGLNASNGLDRPGTPSSPGAWDARSEKWVGDGGGGLGVSVPGDSPAATDDAGSPRSWASVDVAGGAAPRVSDPLPAPGKTAVPRRGAADPVKALMHRHRELCEQAVDPLEIAAGLEAHGVTDRTAGRFLHRDVFSLAEEMYARVPRDSEARPRAEAPVPAKVRAGWVIRTLLPGALCAATLAGLRFTDGQSRLLVAAAGVLAVGLGLRAALTRGPLGTHRERSGPSWSTGTWTCWLLMYAVLGDGLLRAAIHGGPDTLPDGAAAASWPLATAPLPALALACAPAAWTTHLFTAAARRRLTASRGLAEFAGSVRPLLLGTFALYVGALVALAAGSARVLDEPAALLQTLTLGALLLLARLLHLHGFTHAPAMVLAVAASAEALALATVFAARLPGCDFLSLPVETLVDIWGPGSIPTLICGMATLTLLAHASRTLTRASSHARTEAPW
ncbi:hypothetical protein ACFXAZ_18930 [Streptomyces sp. NPDC059477]|uniref:hypothetical protein n=1 Tax=Streptomyces sp. NPDC059477 TaxID=3346847 RepID=UPI0036D0FD14